MRCRARWHRGGEQGQNHSAVAAIPGRPAPAMPVGGMAAPLLRSGGPVCRVTEAPALGLLAPGRCASIGEKSGLGACAAEAPTNLDLFKDDAEGPS